jgi:hypothetical protein
MNWTLRREAKGVEERREAQERGNKPPEIKQT